LCCKPAAQGQRVMAGLQPVFAVEYLCGQPVNQTQRPRPLQGHLLLLGEPQLLWPALPGLLERVEEGGQEGQVLRKTGPRASSGAAGSHASCCRISARISRRLPFSGIPTPAASAPEAPTSVLPDPPVRPTLR